MMRKILAIVLVCFLLLGCEKQSNIDQYKAYTHSAGFDTVFGLIGYSDSKEEFDRLFGLMQQDLLHYHQMFDKYYDYEGVNNIKTINDMAGISPVEVDEEVIEMLLLAKNYFELTNGYFDITIGSVLKLWHDCRDYAGVNGFGCVPTEDALKTADAHTGWNLVEIDETAHTVYIKDAKASLDVGGIAKGFAVEKVAQMLEREGLKYGALDGGGNIRIINGKPDNAPFNVGIANPENRGGQSILILQSKDSYSFVTSGDYERYYLDEYGNVYHHIINPFTLYPSVSPRSITIIYPNSAIADILSTALFIMDYQTAVQWIESFNDPQLDVVWVYDKDHHPDTTDGQLILDYYVIATKNADTYLK